MADRENIGYKIIGSITIGTTEIVLGARETGPSAYVTWECKGGNNYYCGNYFSELLSAQKDFCRRASEQIEIQEYFQSQKNNREEHER